MSSGRRTFALAATALALAGACSVETNVDTSPPQPTVAAGGANLQPRTPTELYDTFTALAAAVERGDADACVSLRDVEVYLRNFAGLDDIGLTAEQRERVTQADTDCFDDRERAVRTLRELAAQRPE